MKAYFSMFKIRLYKGLQYRTAAIAGMTTQFFWAIMLIMVYQAFYSSSTQVQPISLKELVQFVWLQQAFLVFVMLWYRDTELFELISNGNIAYELVRPINLYKLWYSKLLAQRLSGALLRSIPILIVAFLMPSGYKLMLPPSIVAFLLFLITLLLGLILVVAISMLIYISVFYTLSPTGSLLLFSVFGEFFAGLTIPIPLMPEAMQKVMYILPFRYTADLPFRLYSGNIGVKEGFKGLLIQLLWITLLISFGRLWMNKALKKVVVQGG